MTGTGPGAGRGWPSDQFPPIAELWPAVEERFGIVPSFFRLASAEPPIAWMLFRMAEFAYQDNPLPSLFKEQLFTYLSRFCEVRYCVARHCAFLMGAGNSSGDPGAMVLSVDEVLALLREPMPGPAELPALLAQFQRIAPLADDEWPEFHSDIGRLLHVACAVAFLQPSQAQDWLVATSAIVGNARYEQLMLLLAFVRMAHFWTHVHPELAFEEDLEALLRENEVLVGPLLDASEAGQWALGARLHRELQTLRADLSESRLAAIVESSDDAIISKDLDGTVTSWNRGAEQLFGYSAEEMIGQSIRRIIPPDRQHEEDEVLAQIRSGNRVDHFETVRRRKNGTLIDISVTISPIRNHAGEVVGASKIARDISLRRRAEEELKSAVDLKDQFLSLVSHELRSPVTVVISNASLLQRRGRSLSTEDYEQSLQDIVVEGRRLETVIEGLLLLTRLETDRELELEPVSVRRLLAECIDAFSQRYPTRPVELVEDRPPDLVSGQPDLLAMVIGNLLSNADKYSNPGEPVVVLLRTNGHGEAEVTVRDSGIGIDESASSRLFTPFYRSEAAAKQAKGMGIGLAVCKRIIEAHRGRIWASARPEGGTDFTFSLPGAPPDLVEGAR